MNELVQTDINPWLHPPTPGNPPSLSERFIRALEAHASAEAHDLATCQQLSEGSTDPVLKVLIGLVMDHEQRHHSLLQSMIHRLQEEVEFIPSLATALPIPEQEPVPDGQLAEALRGLVRDEHEGARHLRHIARQEPHLYQGLYAVLLEAIARDSEKHATILRYLLLRVEGRGK